MIELTISDEAVAGTDEAFKRFFASINLGFVFLVGGQLQFGTGDVTGQIRSRDFRDHFVQPRPEECNDNNKNSI